MVIISGIIVTALGVIAVKYGLEWIFSGLVAILVGLGVKKED